MQNQVGKGLMASQLAHAHVVSPSIRVAATQTCPSHESLDEMLKKTSCNASTEHPHQLRTFMPGGSRKFLILLFKMRSKEI